MSNNQPSRSEPPQTDGAWPLAYLLTWRTYGTWLPGDERGSVAPGKTTYGAKYQRSDALREVDAYQSMKQSPVLLNPAQRECVERAIEQTAIVKGWTIVTQSARTNHVHVVVSAQSEPEPVMNSLKAWATRRLREEGLLSPDIKPWARHGSTRYLWTQDGVDRAAAYVLEAQDGERFDTEE